jgi:hypothetical protein
VPWQGLLRAPRGQKRDGDGAGGRGLRLLRSLGLPLQKVPHHVRCLLVTLSSAASCATAVRRPLISPPPCAHLCSPAVRPHHHMPTQAICALLTGHMEAGLACKLGDVLGVSAPECLAGLADMCVHAGMRAGVPLRVRCAPSASAGSGSTAGGFSRCGDSCRICMQRSASCLASGICNLALRVPVSVQKCPGSLQTSHSTRCAVYTAL